jgi:hypothetical protein
MGRESSINGSKQTDRLSQDKQLTVDLNWPTIKSLIFDFVLFAKFYSLNLLAYSSGLTSSLISKVYFCFTRFKSSCRPSIK